mmetsp:Transcript_10177/g.24371  ORF Transcript_10177/g.24371 Transcript_10177/m.24371 type:complete len:435 (-) Transcript_10177:173-1477(-)|eukprot:CAMPEP_0172393952 /NCGR_PEP_ID=MMETSP1061-20121228/12648_1 /TAXON_ID=37318 /ORGANISM="Pseudo-nitzschia pungens, Strain cf. pungens" /LENGTH=434 /DNA_ID=CAMNT_0013125185 /DNA_START=8 /DNA_END=1312 /DNA_ORIENTATION=+
MAFTSAGRNDVLCGKGAHGNHHSGNKVFRDMVKSWKPRYERASDVKTSSGKETKVEVSRALVRQVNNEGGHFLKMDEGGYYVEIGFGEAVHKTSQRFRDTPKQGPAPTNIQPVEARILGETKTDDERKQSPMPTTTTIASVETTSDEDVCNAFADSTRVVDDPPPYSNGHREIVANSTAFDVFTEPVYAEACLDASVEESAEHSPVGFNHQTGGMEDVAIATQVSTGDGYNGMGSEEGFVVDDEFYEFWAPECGNASQESINKCSNAESVEDEMVVLASEVPQDDSATNAGGPNATELLLPPTAFLSVLEVSSSPLLAVAEENKFSSSSNKMGSPSSMKPSPTPFVSPAAGLLQDSENGFTSKKRKFGQVKEHEEDVSTDHAAAADPNDGKKQQQQQQQPNKATRTYRRYLIATRMRIAQESANGIFNRETYEW